MYKTVSNININCLLALSHSCILSMRAPDLLIELIIGFILWIIVLRILKTLKSDFFEINITIIYLELSALSGLLGCVLIV